MVVSLSFLSVDKVVLFVTQLYEHSMVVSLSFLSVDSVVLFLNIDTE